MSCHKATWERQDDLVGVATHEDRVNRREERVVAVSFAVRFAASEKEVEGAVEPRDEAVKTGTDEDGCFHFRTSRFLSIRASTDTLF